MSPDDDGTGPLGGDCVGNIDGLGCPLILPSRRTLRSPCSSRLTRLKFELPHVFASRPFGIPPFSATALMPRSPVTTTALLLRLVGAGGLARVDGARLLGGMSRKASLNIVLGLVSSGSALRLGPTGMLPWLAAIRLAIP